MSRCEIVPSRSKNTSRGKLAAAGGSRSGVIAAAYGPQRLRRGVLGWPRDFDARATGRLGALASEAADRFDLAVDRRLVLAFARELARGADLSRARDFALGFDLALDLPLALDLAFVLAWVLGFALGLGFGFGWAFAVGVSLALGLALTGAFEGPFAAVTSSGAASWRST